MEGTAVPPSLPLQPAGIYQAIARIQGAEVGASSPASALTGTDRSAAAIATTVACFSSATSGTEGPPRAHQATTGTPKADRAHRLRPGLHPGAARPPHAPAPGTGASTAA
jgi:hypothetical protein